MAYFCQHTPELLLSSDRGAFSSGLIAPHFAQNPCAVELRASPSFQKFCPLPTVLMCVLRATLETYRNKLLNSQFCKVETVLCTEHIFTESASNI